MLALSFLLVGAFALGAQTILLREYLVLHNGNELAIGSFYGSWFLWIALGATLGLLRERRHGPADPSPTPATLERRFSLLLALYPLALLGQLLLIRATRSLAGVAPTEPFGFGALAGWTLLTNAPVSLVTGMLFPVGCALLRAERPAASPSSAVTRGYVVESLGSFTGGVVVTALLGTVAPALHVGLGAAAALSAGAFGYALRRRARAHALIHAALLVGALGCLATPLATRLGEASIRSRFRSLLPQAEIVAQRDTPYQNAAVARLGEQVLLLSNGRLVASLPDDRAQAMRAALLMSEPAQTRRVLLLGSGAQGLVRPLLAYPLGELRYVESDELAFRLAEPHLPAADRTALADPRLHASFTDGRWLVQSLARDGTTRFDLVLVVLPDPDTAALNRYFTVEFYRAVSALLEPGGVLATRISSGENVLSSERASYGASVAETLRSVFAQVVATPGEESWLFAGGAEAPLSLDADVLARRYLAFPLEPRLFPADGFRSLLDPERIALLDETLRRRALAEPHGLINSDARPVSYFLNLLVLGQQTGSTLTATLRAVREVGGWLFVVPLLAFALLRSHYLGLGGSPSAAARFNAAALTFAFGLASIALQVVLLFAFQSRFGLLYQQIGLAGALFMAGLGAGGALGARAATSSNGSTTKAAAVVLLLLAGEALGVPSLTAWLGTVEPGPARFGYYALFLLNGLASGAAFPVASRLGSAASDRAGALGAILQAADHWGAALGAALAGTVLVPVTGVGTSCLLVAAVLAAVGLPVLLSHAGAQRALGQGLRRLRLLRAPRQPAVRTRSVSFPWTAASYLLLGFAATVAVQGGLLRAVANQPVLRLDPRRLASIVKADRFEEVASPFLHYRAFDTAEERFHNISFSSIAVSPDVVGYGGPLNLLVSIDADGTIRRVELLGSNETPSYVGELPSWLQRFEGKRAGRAFRLVDHGRSTSAEELDGITGATVTSRAALETVNRATAAAAGRILGLAVETTGSGDARASRFTLELGYLLGALALSVPILLLAASRIRLWFLGANLLVAGLVYNLQLSLPHVAALCGLELPSRGNLPVFVLVLGAVGLAVAFGPAYCALLCPFGAAQELVFGAARSERPGDGAGDGTRRLPWRRLARTLCALGLGLLLADASSAALLPSIASRPVRDALLLGALALGFALSRKVVARGAGPPSERLHARARYLKYLLLAAAVAGYALGGADWVLGFDPLSVAFSRSFPPWTFALLGLLLLLCLHYFRFWCRYFCPVGALLNLGNKLGLLLGLVPARRYARCDLGIRSRHDLDCIQCGRCISGATDGANRCLAAARPARGRGQANRARPSGAQEADAP